MPQHLETKFTAAVEELERNKQVNYVTSAERIGFSRGGAEGLAEAVLLLLNDSVGELEEDMRQKITTLPITKLKTLLPLAPKFTSKQELLDWLTRSERKAAKGEVRG